MKKSITPNRRLAIYVHGIPLNTWLEAQYTELCVIDPTLPCLLSSSEEAVIWERIISASAVGQSLLNTSSIVRLAQEAWLLSVQWHLPSIESVETVFQSEDHLAFLKWAHDYQTLCRKEHWVDSATCIDVLIHAIEQNKIALPSEIVLIGFEEFTPQQVRFFEKVRAAGSCVKFESLVPTSLCKNNFRFCATDTAEELKCAVLKSQQWLKQNPAARIGIVVPALAEQRALVVRTLEAVLMPGDFNIAAPLALSRYPIIDSAVAALYFLVGEISLEKWSRFLRSPFFNNASSEQNIRAALDVRIRGFSETVFTLEGIIKKIEFSIQQEPKLAHFTGLTDLQKLVLMRTALRGRQKASLWRDRFLEILSCFGWPGDRLLTSEESDIIEQWQKVLTNYVSMERVLGEHRYPEALSYLRGLLQSTVYAPSTGKRRGQAPIQVLGLLEALGMPFDYLWVTGLHREAWPSDPAPNPLIPLALQRQHDLPRSSAARELKMARQFTERLSEGGAEVIFSYPRMIEERAVSASALITHIPEVSYQDLGLNVKNNKNIENICRGGPLCPPFPVPVGITEKIKGGSHILKLQALCPFRAFAEKRLHAEPIPQKNLGLNKAARGEIIHQILEYFWQGLSDQTALQAMTEDSLKNRIHAAIENVFMHWQARYPRILAPQYLSLEKKRTIELIEKFIALEKSRPYFEVVSTEKKRVINIERLEIKVRIDRIDRLANQSEILMDYKTGEVSINDWFGDRPKDPQLPLYCVTEKQKPSGIVFGIIRPDAVKYQGLAEEADVLPGVKKPENFEAQCEMWEASIALLAREFMQGDARVDPIEGENTCRTCSLKPLCRVHSKVEHSKTVLV